MWVSPFRHLRIKGYLLLPVAFRSLSRLSSALSAKASTLRSFLLDLVYSFYSVRNWVFAFNNADRIASILNFRSFGLVVNFVYDILGCLDKKIIFIKIFCMKFSRYNSELRSHQKLLRNFRNIGIFQCFCYCLTECLSVIRNLNVLKSLITGKTSFIRTTLPCWNRLAPGRLTLDARSIQKAFQLVCFLIWQPPAFPYRRQYSIIGRLGLNHRVRDVDGCFP